MSTTQPAIAINAEVMRELFEALIQKINLKQSTDRSITQLLPLALSSKQAHVQFMFQMQNASLGVTGYAGADVFFKNSDAFYYPVDELGTKYLIPLVLRNPVIRSPIPKWYMTVLKEYRSSITSDFAPVTLVVDYDDFEDLSDFEYLLGNLPIKKIDMSDYSNDMDEVLYRYPNIETIHITISQGPVLFTFPSVKKLSISLNKWTFVYALRISKQTTHVTYEFDIFHITEDHLSILFSIFEMDVECLNVSLVSGERTDVETFRQCFNDFLTYDFIPIMEAAMDSKVPDLKVNFTYNFELPGVSVLSESFINQVNDVLAKADFRHIKSQNNDKGTSEVQFEASPRENLVCAVSVKKQGGWLEYEVDKFGSKFLTPLVLAKPEVTLPLPRWYIDILVEHQFPVAGKLYGNHHKVDNPNLDYLLGNVPIKGLVFYDYSKKMDEVFQRHQNIKNIHVTVFEHMPLPPVKKLSLSLDNYKGRHTLEISPQTTHLTVTLKKRSRETNYFNTLLAILGLNLEYLEMSLIFEPTYDVETCGRLMKTFLKKTYDPIMKQIRSKTSKITDFRVTFEYNVEVKGVTELSETLINEVNLVLSRAGFRRVKCEGQNNDKRITEVRFKQALSRGKIDCVCSVTIDKWILRSMIAGTDKET